jgi:hypothetical protein
VTAILEAAATPMPGRSKEAARLYANLMAVPPTVRRRFMSGLAAGDIAQVLTIAAREAGTPFALWRDDPVGFVVDVLGEATWSKPREILNAVPHTKRVAVPSCFSSGKTWSSARAVLWFSLTRAPGTAKVVTMAPTWRQVVRLLWSEVRSAHGRAKLPGTVDMAQLKIPDAQGVDLVVAYGLSAAPWNEAAVQGIHSPELLLIVDEAGGIGHTIGRNLRGMLSSDGSHMLAIGNPPTDEEDSWFEGLCDQPEVVTIPISVYDTPAMSGEQAPRCRSCHPQNIHSVTRHLVEESWVEETIREHGEDSNYVQAKVYAKFPAGGPSRVIPSAWIDMAHDADEPEPEDDLVRLDSLGLEGENASWLVRRGAWVRLGVDVAADGGDELVITRIVGDLITIQHTSAGSTNTNSVDVAGKVLKEIRKAEALARALGSGVPVRVKLDGIGVGWGVAGLLQSWGEEKMHGASVVSVVVSERTDREPDAATLRPRRKRDEMWLATRHLLEPRGEIPALRLRVDRKTLAQLRAPSMSTDSGGYTVVESKKSLKDRGLSSPDRAEGVLLAVYEPETSRRKKSSLLV